MPTDCLARQMALASCCSRARNGRAEQGARRYRQRRCQQGGQLETGSDRKRFLMIELAVETKGIFVVQNGRESLTGLASVCRRTERGAQVVIRATSYHECLAHRLHSIVRVEGGGPGALCALGTLPPCARPSDGPTSGYLPAIRPSEQIPTRRVQRSGQLRVGL